MRRTAPLVLAALVGAAAPAQATPMFDLEARIGGGLELGGGGGKAVARYAPLSIGFLGELLLRTDVRVAMTLGLYMETLDRTAVGVLGGVRWYAGGPVRLGVGFLGTLAPYTIGGADVSGGACWSVTKKKRVHLCGDVDVALFFFGDDLPDGKVATQIGLNLGAAVDVF